MELLGDLLGDEPLQEVAQRLVLLGAEEAGRSVPLPCDLDDGIGQGHPA